MAQTLYKEISHSKINNINLLDKKLFVGSSLLVGRKKKQPDPVVAIFQDKYETPGYEIKRFMQMHCRGNTTLHSLVRSSNEPV